MKNFFQIFCVAYLLMFLSSCTDEAKDLSVTEESEVPTKVQISELDDNFLSYLVDGFDNVMSLNDNGITKNAKWDINKANQIYSSEKEIVMQVVPSLESDKLIASATINQKDSVSNILLMQEINDGVFQLMDDEMNPILEMTYNSATGKATCSRVNSKSRAYAYICNGAMAVLGWEVSVAMIVPSGGSSLAFAVLWAVVSTAYCG